MLAQARARGGGDGGRPATTGRGARGVERGDQPRAQSRELRGAERCHFLERGPRHFDAANISQKLHRPGIGGHAAIDQQSADLGAVGATRRERAGDAAVNIAQAVQVLLTEPPLKPYIDLPRMCDSARAMLRDALSAFARRDAESALEVCRRDDEIDRLYFQLFRELLTYMVESSGNVRRALHLLLIARNLERVADHATNLSEDVIYYAKGLDVRHSRRSS